MVTNARGWVNQGFLIQRETTPGVAAINAMKRYLGLRVTSFGYDVTKEQHRAAGYKVQTGEDTLTELGAIGLEVRQDFNALLPLLSGAFGLPTTTPVEGATGAFEHVFEIDPRQADLLASYTAMFGDSVLALQATALAFHGLTIGVRRTALNASADAIMRKPKTGIAMPTAGVTEVPYIPVRAQAYDVYMDDTAANWGNTKLLALYATEAQFGAKYTPDWVVNSELDSYSELIENDDINYTQSLTIGFKPDAVALINHSLAGGQKFVRVATEGPPIGASGVNHAFELDTSVVFTPGNVTSGPDAPVTVVEFNGNMQLDATSGSFARARLVNGLEAA